MNDASKLHLKVRNSNGVHVVEFVDRKILEEIMIHEIADELMRLAEARPSINLLLSFKNVEHLSSAALGMLITLNKKVSDKAGQLRLSDITPQIYEVFKITGLKKIFQIHDTMDQALSSF
jgi:anti-sigma B factor antagonist